MVKCSKKKIIENTRNGIKSLFKKKETHEVKKSIYKILKEDKNMKKIAENKNMKKITRNKIENKEEVCQSEY